MTVPTRQSQVDLISGVRVVTPRRGWASQVANDAIFEMQSAKIFLRNTLPAPSSFAAHATPSGAISLSIKHRSGCQIECGAGGHLCYYEKPMYDEAQRT